MTGIIDKIIKELRRLAPWIPDCEIPAATISRGLVGRNSDGVEVVTIDPQKLEDGDATHKAALQALLGLSPIPVGTVNAFAGTAAPTGWLFAYGQAVSRTTYADLFTAIGETYGVGDGSTTFNLPDMRGRVPAGQDDMGGSSANRLTGLTDGVNGDTLGATGGLETATPASRTDMNNTGGTETVATNAALNNIQPTIILNFIIKT